MAWVNRERAYVQLISKLLEVEFDAIWQRHKRQAVQKAICWAIGIAAILATIAAVWSANQPVDIEVSLREVSAKNNYLPPLSNAIVTMKLDNETKTDTVVSLDENAIFRNIPQRFIGKTAHITVTGKDHISADTTLILDKILVLDIMRAPAVYGDVQFSLWNESGEGVPGVSVTIAGQKSVSDMNGYVRLVVPLEKQRDRYHISASVPLAKDTIYMPCCENNIIRVE